MAVQPIPVISERMDPGRQQCESFIPQLLIRVDHRAHFRVTAEAAPFKSFGRLARRATS